MKKIPFQLNFGSSKVVKPKCYHCKNRNFKKEIAKVVVDNKVCFRV